MSIKVNGYTYHFNVYTYEDGEDASFSVSIWKHNHNHRELSVRISNQQLYLPKQAMEELAVEILAELRGEN